MMDILSTITNKFRSDNNDKINHRVLLLGLAFMIVGSLEIYNSESKIRENGRALKASDYDVVTSSIFTEDLNISGFIITQVLILIFGSLAAGAGVGGGGLFVPMYAFILGVGARAAVPLSKATILGGAIGNYLNIGFKRHPKADRPMIDYEASTFMQSGELLGVIFGVLLNILLPEIVIIIMLAVLLTFNSYKTIKKGRSTYAKETKAFEAEAKEKEIEMSETKPNSEISSSGVKGEGMFEIKLDSVREATSEAIVVSNGTEEIALGSEEVDPVEEKTLNDLKLKEILASDSKQFPVWAYSLLLLMTGYTAIYAVLKTKISICDAGLYWSWYMSPVIVLGTMMFLTGKILMKKHLKRVEMGFEYLPADIQWTGVMLKKFPIVALLAGVYAGLLGIGGGMIIGPLFLEIGMEPQVGTGSCAFMILFTATSGVIQYSFAGKLGNEWILWCVGIGLISGQLGQNLVNRVLKKTGRPSYVIFLLGFIILLACVTMTVSGIYKLAQAFGDGEYETMFHGDTSDFKCPTGEI